MLAASPPRELREDELVARIRAGDEAAFTDLVARHHGALVKLARLYTRSGAIAEEVVQDTWCVVLTGIERFEGRSSLKTWIFGILMNRARSAAVRERRSLPASELERPGEDGGEWLAERFHGAGSGALNGEWACPPRPWQDPERRLVSLELRGELRGALAELPPRQQLVVTLRDVEGLSAEEVCSLLELSAENQRVLLHRGRSRLRQALEERFGGAAQPAA